MVITRIRARQLTVLGFWVSTHHQSWYTNATCKAIYSDWTSIGGCDTIKVERVNLCQFLCSDMVHVLFFLLASTHVQQKCMSPVFFLKRSLVSQFHGKWHFYQVICFNESEWINVVPNKVNIKPKIVFGQVHLNKMNRQQSACLSSEIAIFSGFC